MLEPIGVVRDGADRYVCLWGQRRCKAAALAGLTVIPAMVRERPSSEAETMEVRLIENVAREGLRPIEQAVGLDQLMASGLTATEVAKRVGLTPAAVTKSLSLLALPGPLRELVDAGRIPAGAGYELSRVDDPQLQARWAAEVAAGTLTRDGLVGRLRAATRAASTKPAEQRPARVTAKLAGDRAVTVSAADLTLPLLSSSTAWR